MATEGLSSGGSTSTPVIGRHAVLEELIGQLQRVRTGAGRFTLLLGEGGVGKTTFLTAAGEVARGFEYTVLWGRSLPVELPEPFQLVRSLLESVRKSGEASTAPSGSPNLPIFLAPFETDRTGEIARAVGVGGPSRELEEADRLIDHLANPVERVDADRSALFTQLGEFILHVGGQRPLLILLDDLHFADGSSLEFLLELLPALPARSVLVLASSVPPREAPERSRTELERLAGSPLTTTVAIPSMTETELAEYVRWLLNGREPGRDAVMRWYTQTEGNPLFTEYLVRSRAGSPPEGAPAVEAPQDFGEVLKAQVRALPEAERRLLAYGAVLGKEFEFPLVALASGQEEERLSEALDHLVHSGVLREKRGEVYEFVSERVRADVYAQLTETRRRLLHRKVASALDRRGDTSPTAVFELARQLYLGREDRRAVELNRRAADLAAHAFAFESSAIHLERALECQRRLEPRVPGQEILLLVELGRYLDQFGNLHRAEEVLLDAVARARLDPSLSSELAFALLGLAQTRSDLAQYTSTRDLAAEAYRILEGIGHPRGLMTAHRILGVAYWRLGDLEEATNHQREELALAEANGTPADIGHALIDLANTLTLEAPARIEEAMGLYERAAGLFGASEDHAAHARVLMNLALLLYYAGRRDEAFTKMRDALAAAEASRSRVWIGYCSLNLAQFLAERHDPPAAREMLERAESRLGPLGDQLAHQQITMIRGMIAVESEAYDEAVKLFEEASELAQSLHLSAEAAEMEFRFAELELRRGRLPEARAHLEAARAAGLERLRADLLPRVSEVEARLPPAAAGPHG